MLGSRAMKLMEDGLENHRILLEHTPECRLCGCEARRLMDGAAVQLEPLSERDIIIGGRSMSEVRDAIITWRSLYGKEANRRRLADVREVR